MPNVCGYYCERRRVENPTKSARKTQYPVSYSLDGNGKAEHRAIFHDLKANSISGCLLSELEKVEC